jgi:hypothetical protein
MNDSSLARRHGNYDRPKPWRAILVTLLVVLLVGAGLAARISLRLLPPHVVASAPVALQPDLRTELDAALDFERPSDRQQAIDFALDFTARHLSPSPSHKTSLDFGSKKRPGNSTEYAALFAAVLEVTGPHVPTSAHAVSVVSTVRIYGKPVPHLRDHTWSMVYDPADGVRIFLDAMLQDAWLNGDVGWNVKAAGQIAVPTEAGK